MDSDELEKEFQESERMLNNEIGAILNDKSAQSSRDETVETQETGGEFSLLQSFHRQFEEAMEAHSPKRLIDEKIAKFKTPAESLQSLDTQPDDLESGNKYQIDKLQEQINSIESHLLQEKSKTAQTLLNQSTHLKELAVPQQQAEFSLGVGKVQAQLNIASQELMNLEADIDKLLSENKSKSISRRKKQNLVATAPQAANWAKLLQDVEQDVYIKVSKRIPSVVERLINRRLNLLEEKAEKTPASRKHIGKQISFLNQLKTNDSAERMSFNGTLMAQIDELVHQHTRQASAKMRHN